MEAQHLTHRQARFVDEYLVDRNGTQAAIRAGYSPNGAGVHAHHMLKNPKIEAAVALGMAADAKRLEITRQDVLRGLVAAFELAQARGEPSAMIGGCRELSRLCGFNAPERVEISRTESDYQFIERLESMTEDELLGLLDADG